MNRRTLFEQRELVRPPRVRVQLIIYVVDGASMVWGHFAETKGPRRTGTKPRGVMRYAKYSSIVTTRSAFTLIPAFVPLRNKALKGEANLNFS